MKSETGNRSVSKSSGFFREGWREWGRKRERRKLKKQVQRLDGERHAVLTRLGERAWQEKVDLSGLPELREQLTRLETRAGELSVTTQRLGQDKARLEARRQSESAKFAGQRREVEEKKRPADQALTTARRRMEEQKRTITSHQARLASLAAELAVLEKELAAPPPPEGVAQLAARQARQQQLLSEQKRMAEELGAAHSAQPSLAAEVNQFYGESQRLSEEINRIEAERKAVLSPIEAELGRVGRDVGATTQEGGAVTQQRAASLAQLGLALYERNTSEPALAAGMQEVMAIDRARAATQAALEASLALTRALPRGTMLKFSATLVLAPLLLLGLGYGVYSGWTRWRQSRMAGALAGAYVVPPVEINPYLSHPLQDHPAYVLANQLIAAGQWQEVADRMQDVFRAIHLGVYTANGTQVLAGSEQSDKDFYLYDFEVHTLARSFQRRNFLNFDDHSRMLAVSLARLSKPDKLEPLLQYAILQRYQKAVQKPDDPKNFLILLVDGLGRHKPRPYSLAEIKTRPAKDIDLDALQSFLIMLDFFTLPPKPTATALGDQIIFPWNWVTMVHADAPCEGVKGDGSEGMWGEGVSQFVEFEGTVMSGTEIGAELAGKRITAEMAHEVAEGIAKGAKAVGGAAEAYSGIRDLVMLYNLEIQMKAEPYMTHLRHEGDPPLIGFECWVTFNPQDAPTQPVGCGPRAGETPGQAEKDLKGIELTWNIEPDWPAYLTVPSSFIDELTGHLGFQTHTDEKGHSFFMLEAGDCPYRGACSKVVGRVLRMTATARFITSKMPSPETGVPETLLGAVPLIAKLAPGAVEYLLGGRKGFTFFEVAWHQRIPKHGQYCKGD